MPDPLGAGIIGTVHSHAVGNREAIRGSANYSFIAAAEPNAELLARAKLNQRWKDVTWVGVDELLADKRIQLVCIETDPLESLPTRRARSRPASTPKSTSPRRRPGSSAKDLRGGRAAASGETTARDRVVGRTDNRALLEFRERPMRLAAIST